mmetsp:Transcript_9271/g.21541  ORF Transcript_9271/g.21541 Transcript_9271/m.21541 type:complete len:269 (+) Transcript_9271:771-1577(+)
MAVAADSYIPTVMPAGSTQSSGHFCSTYATSRYLTSPAQRLPSWPTRPSRQRRQRRSCFAGSRQHTASRRGCYEILFKMGATATRVTRTKTKMVGGKTRVAWWRLRSRGNWLTIQSPSSRRTSLQGWRGCWRAKTSTTTMRSGNKRRVEARTHFMVTWSTSRQTRMRTQQWSNSSPSGRLPLISPTVGVLSKVKPWSLRLSSGGTRNAEMHCARSQWAGLCRWQRLLRRIPICAQLNVSQPLWRRRQIVAGWAPPSTFSLYPPLSKEL